MTIEFIFYKPKDPLAPSSQPRDPPFTLLTHRNDMKTPLLTLLRNRLQETGKSKKADAYPQWVRHLIFPDDEDPDGYTNPQCVMATRLDPLAYNRLTAPSQSKRAHYAFDPTQTLSTLLRHTQFVEFPTIEVWDEFEGTIVDVQGMVTQEEQRPQKRRRLNAKAGKVAIAGLIGGYGSSEDEDNEEEPEEPQNVLAALDEYSGSEGEGDPVSALQDSKGDEGSDGSAYDSEADGGIDDVTLLEITRLAQAQGGESWAVEDDEVVDWGDMDDDEPE